MNVEYEVSIIKNRLSTIERRIGVRWVDKEPIQSIEQEITIIKERLSNIEVKLRITSVATVPERLTNIEDKLESEVTISEPKPKPITEAKNESIPKRKNWNEAIVGKYLIGGIASLLVFIAAISLIALFWESMSNSLKFGLILLSGLGLLSVGYIRLDKYKNAVSSILIGTGAGLVFIALGAGNIVFHTIGDEITVILLSIWAMGLILSFKYSKLFFTTVTAYIGVIIAIIFMISRINTFEELLIILMFALVVTASMLVSAKIWMEKIYQYVTGILSFVIPFGLCCYMILNYRFFSIKDTTMFFIQMALIILIYVIYAYTAFSFDRVKYNIQHIASELMLLLSGILVLNWLDVFDNYEYIGMPNYVRALIAVVIFTSIFISTYKDCIVPILLLSFTVCGMISILPHVELSIGLGFIVFITIFFRKMRFNQKYIVTLLLAIPAFLLLVTNWDYNDYTTNTLVRDIIYSADTLLVVGTLLIVLYDKYKERDSKTTVVIYKILGFCIIVPLLAVWAVHNIPLQKEWVDMSNEYGYTTGGFYRYSNTMLRPTIGMGIVSLLSIIFFASGYFMNWAEENFQLFKKGLKRYNVDLSGMLFTILMIILYIIDIMLLCSVEKWYEHLIAILITTSIAFLQSYILLNKYRSNILAMLWTGVKYFILAWTILASTVGVGVLTITASVVGMGVAVLAILVGVKLRVKSLRLYGLIITLLMAIKVLLIDLSNANSVTRILALLIGGIICFGISVVYTQLETKLKEE